MVNVMGVDQKEKLQYSVYNEKYSPDLNFVEIFFAIVLPRNLYIFWSSSEYRI